MVKVSVVVPVFNPGSNLDDLVASVLGQSLPADEFEAIFVDDGSTDGTGERLDALEAAHSFVRVEHIPNSGWPGRPRNVGTDLARGTYVLYVDNDDYLAPQAVERLHAKATADGADVVVGKVVGHGKVVPRDLFKEDRSGVTVAWPPLLNLLTPHKLFRRAFLAEHGIRFPEGRRRLEDHVFVMRAFFAAQDRISILASYPCYHWVWRSHEANASFGRRDHEAYFHDLRDVIDVVEANVERGSEEWERLLAHWYRSKVLWQLTAAKLERHDREYIREALDASRAVALERFPPIIDPWLPAALRVRSHLLRAGDLDGLYALAELEARLRSRVLVTKIRREPDTVTVRLEARLRGMKFRRDGERVLWEPPEELRGHLDGLDLDFTESVENAHVTPLIRAADRTEVTFATEQSVRLRGAGEGLVTPVVRAKAVIPASSLSPGEWRLVIPVRVSGLSHTAMGVRWRDRDTPGPLLLVVQPDGRFHTPSLTRRRLHRRLPFLMRLLRRRQDGRPRSS